MFFQVYNSIHSSFSFRFQTSPYPIHDSSQLNAQIAARMLSFHLFFGSLQLVRWSEIIGRIYTSHRTKLSNEVPFQNDLIPSHSNALLDHTSIIPGALD